MLWDGSKADDLALLRSPKKTDPDAIKHNFQRNGCLEDDYSLTEQSPS
jgi:hypothetical protein